jgi:hypothetical protein
MPCAGSCRPEVQHRRLFQAPGNARFVQIVRRHLHSHAVAGGNSDPALAHFAADGGEDRVIVVELDAKHSAGKHGAHDTFDFNVFLFHNLVHARRVPDTSDKIIRQLVSADFSEKTIGNVENLLPKYDLHSVGCAVGFARFRHLVEIQRHGRSSGELVSVMI